MQDCEAVYVFGKLVIDSMQNIKIPLNKLGQLLLRSLTQYRALYLFIYICVLFTNIISTKIY